MKSYLYRASNLKSTISFLSSVSWLKSVSGGRCFLQFIHNNNNNNINNNNFYHHHQLLQTSFLRVN